MITFFIVYHHLHIIHICCLIIFILWARWTCPFSYECVWHLITIMRHITSGIKASLTHGLWLFFSRKANIMASDLIVLYDGNSQCSRNVKTYSLLVYNSPLYSRIVCSCLVLDLWDHSSQQNISTIFSNKIIQGKNKKLEYIVSRNHSDHHNLWEICRSRTNETSE